MIRFNEESSSASDGDGENPPSKRQVPLIRQLGIPVERLDYGYVGSCTDSKQIENILRVLRSGEEGRYLDLEVFVENRLRTLNPRSKSLRKVVPIATQASLSQDEMQLINQDLTNWFEELEQNDNSKEHSVLNSKDIFVTYGSGSGFSSEVPILETDPTMQMQVPIRGVELTPSVTVRNKGKGSGDTFLKKHNPNRIKSWEYDRWDKFNVDAELTKLEIEEMREEEEVQRQIEISKDEQEFGEIYSNSNNQISESKPEQECHNDYDKKNFSQADPSIEPEPIAIAPKSDICKMVLQADKVKDSAVAHLQPQRRFKIVIEDLNISSGPA